MFNLCVIIALSFLDDELWKKILGLHLDKCSMYVQVHAVMSYDNHPEKFGSEILLISFCVDCASYFVMGLFSAQ